MGRDHIPVPGQWYESLDDEEVFQVLSVDEDAELIELQYEDGDVEEIDYETWQVLDLELSEEPEGWSGSEDDEADEEDDDEDEDEDDDWDDDEDERRQTTTTATGTITDSLERLAPTAGTPRPFTRSKRHNLRGGAACHPAT